MQQHSGLYEPEMDNAPERDELVLYPFKTGPVPRSIKKLALA